MKAKKRIILPLVLIGLLLIAGLVWFFFGRQDATDEAHGKSVEDMLGEQRPQRISYQGKTYEVKDQLKTYLFMGIDRDGETTETQNLFAGQSDTMLLLVVDEAAKTYTSLLLDRDTMTTVEVLDNDGSVVNTAQMQLCLAHSYGTGGKDSCENAVRAVSRLLYDTPVDAYTAVQMDAMPVLNDALGGVTVTIEDDFSAIDPTLPMGETIKLSGEQAYHYLRTRMGVGDGNNTGRMRRQQTYLDAAVVCFRAKDDGSGKFAAELYQQLQPYMVSTLSGQDINTLAKVMDEYTNNGFCTIDGEHQIQDGFMQFHADETSLRETVLSLFYQEVPAE